MTFLPVRQGRRGCELCKVGRGGGGASCGLGLHAGDVCLLCVTVSCDIGRRAVHVYGTGIKRIFSKRVSDKTYPDKMYR
jgi:hypothetical protein